MQTDTAKPVEMECPPRHLAAVFVCRLSQPTVLNTHLPQLIATASPAFLDLPPIRLVQLSRGSEEALCSSLGLPRVSFLAVMDDTPLVKPLIEIVRDNVPVIEVEWLTDAQNARYMPVQINAIRTKLSAPKKAQIKRSQEPRALKEANLSPS